MKIWVDDVRTPPNDEEYIWVQSVFVAEAEIKKFERLVSLLKTVADVFESVCGEESSSRQLISKYTIELIDLDHDAGDYDACGGDYIKLLDWLEETGRNYPIRIHSQNPVGVENMRRIIQRNGWKEIS